MMAVFPLRTEEDYKKALALIEHTPSSDPATEDAVEILSQLVKLWEKEHHAFESKVAPQDLLRELMLLKNVGLAEIAARLSTPTTNVSALLGGRRKLNSAQAESLAEFFHVDVSIFGKVKRPRFSLPRAKGQRQRA